MFSDVAMRGVWAAWSALGPGVLAFVRKLATALPVPPSSAVSLPSSSPGSWKPWREQENAHDGVTRSSWAHSEGRSGHPLVGLGGLGSPGHWPSEAAAPLSSQRSGPV